MTITKDELTALGFKVTEDRRNSLSSNLARGWAEDDVPTVVPVHGEARDRLHAVVDGVHWLINVLGESAGGRLRVMAPSDTPDWVVDGLVRLSEAALEPLRVQVCVGSVKDGALDYTDAETPKPFEGEGRLEGWALQLQDRDDAALAPAAQRIGAALAGSVGAFRWYRNVSGKYWSGRVAGWEVCQVTDNNEICWKPSSNVAKTRQTVAEVVAQVTAFAADRANPEHARGQGKLEHLLEAAVLQGEVPITVDGTDLALLIEDDAPPFQFPALGSRRQPRRSRWFMDVLMKDGAIPWVVELKVKEGARSDTQYFRHGVTQAVLYRAFIKGLAGHLKDWFTSPNQGLTPCDCRSALAFPTPTAPGKGHLKRVARAFDVAVVADLRAIDELRDLIAL